MKTCGVSEEILAGLEDLEKIATIEQAELVPEKIERLFQENPPKTLEELSLKYEHLLKYHFYFSNNESLNLYADSLELISSKDDKACYLGRSSMLFIKANLLDSRGMPLIDIINLQEEGIQYLSRFDDPCRLKIIPLPTASIYERQQKFEELIDLHKQEIALMDKCEKFKLRSEFASYQSLLNSIAVYFEKLNALDSAEFYYQQALKFIQNNSSEFVTWDNYSHYAEAVVKGNLGGIYTKKGDLLKAKRYLQEAIHFYDSFNIDPKDEFLTKIKMMDLQVKLNSIQSFNELYAELSGSEILDNDDMIAARFYKTLSEIFSEKQQYDKALKYYRLYKHSEDEINRKFEEQRDKDIDEKILYLQQKASLESLQRANEQKSKTLWGIGLIVFLSVVLILLLLSKRREQKKHYKNLSELHEQVIEKNQELLTSLNNLQSSQEENKKVLRVLAHDLRTPLAAMVNMSDLLLLEELAEKEKQEIIHQQKESALHVLSIIKDLLLPSWQGAQSKQVILLKSLIASCIAALKPFANEKNIHVELIGSDAEVLGYNEKLWRLFSNLLSNAIKFSHKNSVIKVKIEVQAELVHVHVADHGIGIPSNQLGDIFNLLNQTGRIGTDGEASHGMGLAICKRIVELHEGDILCQSVENEGSTFTVILPLAPPKN